MPNYAVVAALLMVSGCASIASGTTQQIAITSTPTGATCDLSRQGLTLQQVTTPASSLVQKSKYDLSLQCTKSGYQTTSMVNVSGVEPWVFGNLVFGGLIGLLIDVSGGAQNHYDTAMTLNLPANMVAAPVAAEPMVTTQPII